MNTQAKLELLKTYYSAHGIDLSMSQVTTLQRTARRLQRGAEQYCNGSIDSDQWEILQIRSLNKLKEIFAATKVSPSDIEISGDPRGYVLRIAVENDTLSPEHFN